MTSRSLRTSIEYTRSWQVNVAAGVGDRMSQYLTVLSQEPETAMVPLAESKKRTHLTGCSCSPIFMVCWLPRSQALTALSAPPERTLLPSCWG